MDKEHPAADLLRAIADGKQMEFDKENVGWKEIDPDTALHLISAGVANSIRIARPMVERTVRYPEPLQMTAKVRKNILDAEWRFATAADAAEAHRPLFGGWAMTKETSIAEEFMRGVQERERLRELGKKIEKLAAEKGIFRLTETKDRSRLGDTWTETTTDWSTVARLFEALKVEIDTK